MITPNAADVDKENQANADTVLNRLSEANTAGCWYSRLAKVDRLHSGASGCGQNESMQTPGKMMKHCATASCFHLESDPHRAAFQRDRRAGHPVDGLDVHRPC